VYPGHIPPTLPLGLTLTLPLTLTPTLTLTLTLTKAELRAEAARREAAAVAAAREELLVLVTAEEKEEVREARRGKAVAEAGLRVAEKRAEAAEKRAKAAEANAERVAAEATRAKEELASFEADVACTIDAGAEQHGQDTATQEVRHKKSLCALKAVHRSALSKLGQQLTEAQTAAAEARAQWISAATKLGRAQTTADEKSARVELQEAELERLRPLVARLSVAHGHIAARDARISQLLAREQLPANGSRAPTRSDACPACNRPAGLIVLPHESGTQWPLWQAAIARRLMSEGHVTPSNLGRVLSGALVFFTGQLPTAEYVCDDKFGTRCFSRLGVIDDARDRAKNAADEHGVFMMTDGGSGDGRGPIHTRNSSMHVQNGVVWAPSLGLHGAPEIIPMGLKVTHRDTGAALAETNITTHDECGFRWPLFNGIGGDHTEHSSGEKGERQLVVEHAERNGCPEGRADKFGCTRHGYSLVEGAGVKALWSLKSQMEVHSRLIWENLSVSLGANKKQWVAAGLPEALWDLGAQLWRTEPTTSKWGVMTTWARGGFAKWNVRVQVRGGQWVNAHTHFAKHMVDRLRGVSTKGGSAGGDRLRKWEMHLGVVSNPVSIALFVALLDFDRYFTARHTWCTNADGRFGFAAPFHAHEVAAKMCEDEVELAAAVEEPTTFFTKMSAYLEDRAQHPTPLKPADKAELLSRMATAASDMHAKHREWNWAQWTRARLLFGVATDEHYRRWFVGQLLTCVGEGAALAAALSGSSPAPMPTDAAAPHVAKLLKEHAAGLKEQWLVWSLGKHLPEWLLLATRPEGSTGLFGGQLTPGLWTAFIPMLFLVPTDNTPCEQRVSVYRHQVSQNQDESTVEAQWKFMCRLQKQREALLGLRSLASKYNGRKAAEAAAAGRKLSGHARSKLQLLELWRGALQLALTYTMREVRALQVAKLVRAVRQGRRDVHDAAQALEVHRLASTCARGPKGGRRKAAMTAEAAVALCPSLAELSKGGKFTAAGVKARIRSVTAELKQALAARLAAKAAATEAATAAAEIAAAARRETLNEESRGRIKSMWAHGRAAEADSEEEDEDEGEAAEDSSDGDEDEDGGWGPGAGDASSSEEEEEAPSPTRRREVELPSATDAVAEAAEAQVASAQLQAERDAAAELELLETRRAARDAAAASRSRLLRLRVQLSAVVGNHCRKYGIRPEMRTAVGLAAAPEAVRAAFEELQRVEADLRACEVA
jgi:hypothetical protein